MACSIWKIGRVTEALDYACRNGGVGRSVEGTRWRHFVTNA